MTEVSDPQAWDRVKTYLGDDLRRYLLAQPNDSGAASLSDAQVEVANLLVGVFATSQLEAWNALLRWNDIAMRICQHNPQLGLSLATSMHLACGDQPAGSIDEADALEAALCRLALDVYPLFLIGGRGNGSQFDVMTSMWSHPQRTAAVSAMFQPNEPLMKLFPTANFTDDPTAMAFDLTSHVSWSNGSGGTIQLQGLPQAILLRAPGALREGATPLNSYLHSVRDTLASARSLAEGKVTRVPAIVGCYSVDFADDLFELSLDGARFRRKTAVDHSLIAESPHENIILEVDVKLQATEPAEPDSSKWPTGVPSANNSAGERLHEEMQDRINRARLAVLLASADGEVLAVGQSFLSVPNPLSLNSSWGKSPLAWPHAPFHSRRLSAADEATVVEWDRMLSMMPPGMRTGTERLLSSVSERFSPHDGFIDAVITWENLFGASADTKLRVSGALAWVLYPDDAEARAAGFRKMQGIYDDRSALVHGNDKKRITAAQATALRDEAVHVAIRAIRAVMRSEELRGAKDSIERSKLVLINGAR